MTHPAPPRRPTGAAAAAQASPLSAEARPQPPAPARTLPERLVPRPVREIVEVVPGLVWGALAVLALLAAAFAGSSWVTAMRARRLERQRQELLQEVGLLQAALLPAVPDYLPASVAYSPVDGPAAGGDFYEVFPLPDARTGIVLGEVSGEGRDALSRATLIRYTLRAHLEAGLEPREVVKVGAQALNGQLRSSFATVVVAIHEPSSGRFTYATAGHPPPVVVGPAAHEPVTAGSAPPVGIDEPTGYRQTTFTLGAGSALCLYTDGVAEARSHGRMLGRHHLEETLATLPGEASAEDLLDAVRAGADEIADDMAVCLVRAPETAPAAGPRIEELEVDEVEVGNSLEHFLRACGVQLAEVPGILREAGEAARREGSATVRVRMENERPSPDIVPGNVVRLDERRRAAAR